MKETPGILGMRPSRQFKIFETRYPAIFRWNGQMYMERIDGEFVKVPEPQAMKSIEEGRP